MERRTKKSLGRSVSMNSSPLTSSPLQRSGPSGRGGPGLQRSATMIVGGTRAAASGDKKKVRFALRPKTRVFYKHDNTEGCLWFNKEDFRENKRVLEEEGKEWQAKGYDILLKDAYSNPSREQLDTYVQLPGDDYKRGCETWLCDALYHQRTFARHRSVEATIEKEIQLKEDPTKTPEEIAQELAILYSSLASSARDFAKRMGMADELGDKLGENPELPLYILPKTTKAAPNKTRARPSVAKKTIPQATGGLVRLVTGMATAMGA